MFKVGAAILVAAIAGLVIFLAGLGSGARWSTMFFRTALGFIVIAPISYGVGVLLERFWAGMFKIEDSSGLVDEHPTEEKDLAGDVGVENDAADMDADTELAEDTAQMETEFSPLAQEVPHLQVVDEEQGG